MTTTITTACHTAHLDPLTGVGLLVLPDPGTDLTLRREHGHGVRSVPSLQGSDLQALKGRLPEGWSTLEGDPDDDAAPMMTAGRDRDGRAVVWLGGPAIDPVGDFDDRADAARPLADELGIALAD